MECSTVSRVQWAYVLVQECGIENGQNQACSELCARSRTDARARIMRALAPRRCTTHYTRLACGLELAR